MSENILTILRINFFHKIKVRNIEQYKNRTIQEVFLNCPERSVSMHEKYAFLLVEQICYKNPL
ncbi:hypothetical protein ANAPC3_01367 [Anaplasma phagocytophilum]|nr:hypothetical protein ANAPC3_01367 [Anaplasma phagocytophilum]